MRSHIRQVAFPAALTFICLLGVAASGLSGLGAREARAQQCSNSRCSGASMCVRQASEECSFPDHRSCLTQRCAFGIPTS